MSLSDEEPVRIPITGELDLHTFSPKDLSILLPAYLDECRAKGLLEVRVVHGKGSGVLRSTVRKLLQSMPGVLAYRNGDEHSGGWGATLVTLRPSDCFPRNPARDRPLSKL
jgi:DNA-nicking Smr family endonuclease